MKILVIGSNGQLGRELIAQCDVLCIEAQKTDLPEFDITDRAQVDRIIADMRPTIVINAAAYTNVDGAETDNQTAYQVNRNAPAYLAGVCSRERIPLIHFSTDYVFNGEHKTHYKETDPVSPLNVYGQSKWEGENGIREQLKDHIIIRTSWLYGVHGHNFVKTILRLGNEKETIDVVNDQFGSPTYASDLAETVLSIVSRIHQHGDIEWGTYHYCNEGVVSWHAFAEAIVDIAKHMTSMKVKALRPVSSAVFASAARRPSYSVLDCQRIQKQFGIHPKPWRQSLERMIFRFFNEYQNR